MTDETPNTSDAAHDVPPVEPALPSPAASPSASTWSSSASQPAQPGSVSTQTTPGRTMLVVVVILLILVAFGGIITWRRSAASADQIAQLQNQLDELKTQADALQARPLPPPPPPPPNLAPIEQRLTTLENKPPPQAQLDAAGQQQIASLAGRVDGIAARQSQLGTQEQSDILKLQQTEQADTAKINDQLTGLDTRLTAASKAGGEISQINERQARIVQLQGAAAALAAGRPLGTINGAPPALAQFATKPAPTEASLRLSFDAAAADARRAGQPYTEQTPFLNRMWDRLQSGVVVREGDRVIVGDAVSGVLEHAKRQLDAGDLPGAVAALDGLAGPAAAAMAPWRAQAQSLIDARAALISAAHS